MFAACLMNNNATLKVHVCSLNERQGKLHDVTCELEMYVKHPDTLLTSACVL